MGYMVSATRGLTAMASSARTAVQAIEWIRSRRVVGADHFHVIDCENHNVTEFQLGVIADQE